MGREGVVVGGKKVEVIDIIAVRKLEGGVESCCLTACAREMPRHVWSMREHLRPLYREWHGWDMCVDWQV